jgi:hypothetical protein
MASDRPKRKAIPLRVKLASVMIALGNDHAFCIDAANDPLMGRALMVRLIAAGLRSLRLPPDVDYDHDPALGLRPVNAAGDDYDPPQLDPRHITPRAKADHRTKTTGTPPGQKVVTVASGDIHRISKAKRLDDETAAFRRRLLSKGSEPAADEKPRRKMQGRGFSKRPKP